MTLEDNKQIKDFISVFQEEYPDVKFQYETTTDGFSVQLNFEVKEMPIKVYIVQNTDDINKVKVTASVKYYKYNWVQIYMRDDLPNFEERYAFLALNEIKREINNAQSYSKLIDLYIPEYLRDALINFVRHYSSPLRLR